MTADRRWTRLWRSGFERCVGPSQWLELRFVAGRGAMLRGIIARNSSGTVVALRNAELLTFTAMDIDHPQALVPVLSAGLSGQSPARFEEFSLPARAGAKADERMRDGRLGARPAGLPGNPVVRASGGGGRVRGQPHLCRRSLPASTGTGTGSAPTSA